MQFLERFEGQLPEQAKKRLKTQRAMEEQQLAAAAHNSPAAVTTIEAESESLQADELKWDGGLNRGAVALMNTHAENEALTLQLPNPPKRTKEATALIQCAAGKRRASEKSL